MEDTYATLGVVGLRFFIEYPAFSFTMDHSPVHWDSLTENRFQKTITSGIFHRVNPTL